MSLKLKFQLKLEKTNFNDNNMHSYTNPKNKPCTEMLA